MTEVVVLGDVNVDVIVSYTGAIEHASDSPAHISFTGGGSAANAACWLGHIGVSTAFVGAVGNDANAVMVLDEFARHNVVAHVARSQQHGTGTCVVLVDATGERTMFPDAGANADLAEHDLPLNVIREAQVLLVSAYALFRHSTREVALSAMAAARGAGATVFVDAASRAPLEQVGSATFMDWVGDAFVLANRDEAALLSGPHIIVKQGADGATWADVHVPASPATLVDTTGAGDAFAAGFIQAWLRSRDPHVCLSSAAATAAHAVGVRGARPAPAALTG